ncbi:hypothetical protein Ga0100231_013780 [Opitutaceae bacterium TAV4]|nr:hypothetical protein Ga0100231_013780 [Opitutaceae bacterium TAV4]RRJ99478.1 hypothetical protein Ga0100230_015130 [Opitutaceae bacterium TAV3]
MKTSFLILSLVLGLFAGGCMSQKSLSKDWVGRPGTEYLAENGSPKDRVPGVGDSSTWVYETDRQIITLTVDNLGIITHVTYKKR